MEKENEVELVCKNCKHFDGKYCNESEKKDTTEIGHCSVFEKYDETEDNERILEVYRNIIDILKKYCDLNEKYYSLISLWIIGTYLHGEFETYPYLFLNAMKGSGKTRLLKLIIYLSANGEMLTSPTEAVLFRTSGTLGIDEFEGLTRKGSENIRELLNASYKKGSTVKRMKKKRTQEGEEQVVESFNVYRPIIMANIWGMENVLGDRCLSLIIEKSNRKEITKLVELFKYDESITNTLTTLTTLFDAKSGSRCRLCSVGALRGMYIRWNDYVLNNYTDTLLTYTTNTTHTTYNNNNNNNNNNIYNNNNINKSITKEEEIFKKIDKSNIDGRHLELSLPLFILASNIGDDVLDNLVSTIKDIVDTKKEDDFTENRDVTVIDFVSQELPDNNFNSMSRITKKFKEFTQSNDEWVKPEWMGRALKRIGLIKYKRRLSRGVEVILNVPKAQEKIKLFKTQEEISIGNEGVKA